MVYWGGNAVPLFHVLYFRSCNSVKTKATQAGVPRTSITWCKIGKRGARERGKKEETDAVGRAGWRLTSTCKTNAAGRRTHRVRHRRRKRWTNTASKWGNWTGRYPVMDKIITYCTKKRSPWQRGLREQQRKKDGWGKLKDRSIFRSKQFAVEKSQQTSPRLLFAPRGRRDHLA